MQNDTENLYDIFSYSNKQVSILQAVTVLKQDELYTQAAQLYWTLLRNHLFHVCFQLNINYRSTNEAFVKLLSFEDDFLLQKSIHFVNTLSIIIEWDQEFIIDKSNFINLEKKVLLIIKKTYLWVSKM